MNGAESEAADHRSALAGSPPLSLIRSLIRLRSAAFRLHHREQAVLVTDVAGPHRTPVRRLGKRVGIGSTGATSIGTEPLDRDYLPVP
jgi:hypothetical protein